MKNLTIVLLLGIVSTTGCSSWSSKKDPTSSFSWASPSTWFKKEYQEPDTLAAIWSPDVLVVANKGSTRGFGGRIYFYNSRSQAIPVDGDLVVHGYEASGNTQERQASVDRTADKTFKFSAEELVSHFSPSQLGASYSIWVPWDAADGPRKEITLIPTFKAKDGKTVVQGSVAKLYLPGPETDESGQRKIPAQSISYRSSSMPTHTGAGLGQASSPSEMRTTTIDLGGGSQLANRMYQGAAAQRGTSQQSTQTPQAITVGAGGVRVGGPVLQEPAVAPSGRRSFELRSPAGDQMQKLRSALEQINQEALQPQTVPATQSEPMASLPTIPATLNWDSPVTSRVAPASFTR